MQFCGKGTTAGTKQPRPSCSKADTAIHRINHHPVDTYWGNQLHYPLDRDIHLFQLRLLP